MSVSTALAASQLDLKLCYIDSEFDPEMRQAIPGTEKLCILSNPTVLFGDRDMGAATQMFKSGSYLGAAERFGELSGRVSAPARARYLCDLAALYQSWCDMDDAAMPVPAGGHGRPRNAAAAAGLAAQDDHPAGRGGEHAGLPRAVQVAERGGSGRGERDAAGHTGCVPFPLHVHRHQPLPGRRGEPGPPRVLQQARDPGAGRRSPAPPARRSGKRWCPS